jgi:hypothetical protein
VQLAEKLEAKQAMEKAEWDLWKEADKGQEDLDLQINGPLLFEWDDLSEEALQEAVKRLRQRWKEMVITSHFGRHAMKHGPPIHLPCTIKLDPTPRSLIRGNGGGKGGKRQGQLISKTWEVVETLPSMRMGAA